MRGTAVMSSPESKGYKYGADSEERDNFDSSYSPDMRNQSHSLTKNLSEVKQLKRLYQQKPVVVDITDNQTEKSTMPSVNEQMDTLKAIQGYNKGLKPARRAKDSLPEIVTTNIAARDRYVKDYKK